MWLSALPCRFVAIWSTANDSPGKSENSPGRCFM